MMQKKHLTENMPPPAPWSRRSRTF